MLLTEEHLSNPDYRILIQDVSTSGLTSALNAWTQATPDTSLTSSNVRNGECVRFTLPIAMTKSVNPCSVQTSPSPPPSIAVG